MTYIRNVTTQFDDSPNIDAFGRLRVSNPTTLFDSKQLHDKLPLIWDEEIVNSGSTTSTHSTADAATTMTVGAASGDYVIRQTKQRFNYQPGKSQQCMFTLVLGAATTNVTKKVGYFNTSTASPYTANIDGVYLAQDGTTQYVTIAKNGTEDSVAQANWNIDPFDGTGPSGVTIDWTKSQIFVIDFEWLGVGRVRTGLVVDGVIYYGHEFLEANASTAVYMSSPNHSCRYEIRSQGGTASLMHICSTVISEGGSQALGAFHYASTSGTHVDCTTEDTFYAIVGIRLASTALDTSVFIADVNLQIQTASHKAEWRLILNPSLGSALSYSPITNSRVEYATGATANTVTNGTVISGGFFESSARGGGGAGSVGAGIRNALRIGADIDGTADQLVLAVAPVAGSSAIDVEGSMFWRELS
jgi:hypothetical protein